MPSQNILGVKISVVNLSSAVETIGEWIDDRSPEYVCVTPAHGIMDCYHDPILRDVFNRSGMTTPDGMAVVWLLKLFGHTDVDRVYGPDLMLRVCEHGLDPGWRHFFYGGKPGVANQLKESLQKKLPGLKVVGTHSPPFRDLNAVEREEIASKFSKADPDIIWVGISTPKQEKWMAEFVSILDVPVLVGVGAAFDFLSGNKPQAPRWIQRSGLEWLFRLMSEPKRLWKRYIQYPKFVLLALGQLFGILDFSETETDV